MRGQSADFYGLWRLHDWTVTLADGSRRQPFDVDAQEVHHGVTVSLIPQWVGTTLSRSYQFSDDGRRLILTADAGDFSDCLVWERES